MKKCFLFFLLFSLHNLVDAQVDSIQNEIMGIESTKYEIVQKARRLIIDKLANDDIGKIKAIKDYLDKEFQSADYYVFSMPEYWLILYWTQEYEELLSSIERVGYQEKAKEISFAGAQLNTINDGLLEKLKEKSGNAKEIIEVTINVSQLHQEEKDFLKLHLNYCLSNNNDIALNQENLNLQSDKFLITYPSSIYGPFIRKVIRYKEIVSDFGWGYDLFLGYNVLNGGISESFSDYFLFGMSMDIVYKNYNLNLSFAIGSTTLKKDIDYQSIIWDKDRQGDVFIPQASLGYTLFANKQINFTPFVGVSGFYITPKYDDIQAYSQFENIELNSDASWNAGLSINLFTKPTTGGRFGRRVSQFQAFLKLKYNYFHSGYKKDYYGLDGAVHQVSLSFGGFTRRVRRVY